MGNIQHQASDIVASVLTQTAYVAATHHTLMNIGQLDIAQTWTAQQIFNALKLGGALDANIQNITSVNSLSFGTDTNIRFIVGSRTGEVGFIAPADGATARSITFYTQSGVLAGVGASNKRLDIGGGSAESTAAWTNIIHTGLKLGGVLDANSFNIKNILELNFGTDTFGGVGAIVGPRNNDVQIFSSADGTTARKIALFSQGGVLGGIGNSVERLRINAGAAQGSAGITSYEAIKLNGIATTTGGAASSDAYVAVNNNDIRINVPPGQAVLFTQTGQGRVWIGNSVGIGGSATGVGSNVLEFRAGATLTGSQAQIGAEADGGGLLFNVASGKTFVFEVNAVTKFIIDSNGNAVLRTTAGPPSDTPANGAMEYDTTNNRLYVYNGGWKSVALA